MGAAHLMPQENRQQRIFTIALAGNPNVGKSTVFNSLTGLNQHTGNWPGKTVVSARGKYIYKGSTFELVDLPGTYSLMPNSAEEETARDFICFGSPDATVVIADATCLERNLNLLMQIMEITPNVVLCINLMDEAAKKKITINLNRLSEKLGVPVISTSAREGKGLNELMESVMKVCSAKTRPSPKPIQYSEEIEQAVAMMLPALSSILPSSINSRFVALRLLDGEDDILPSLINALGFNPLSNEGVQNSLAAARLFLSHNGINPISLPDAITTQIVKNCETLSKETVAYADEAYHLKDRRIDIILTSKMTGIPIMVLLLFFVFWLTMAGANVPSAILSKSLFSLIAPLTGFLSSLALPGWLVSLLVDGMYKTLAWVVSVMLPPMAIFFPLFTLLEDLGYLPRIAFNLDHFFHKACAHGKQALTMCMGFGCNACGVIGCRIIDSPRERLIAILTNNFVPCNGRFPTLITIILLFFASSGGFSGSVLSTILLTGVVVLGVAMTLLISKFLSKTLLQGVPSSFQLELPPYRRPQIGRVILRSMLDRTLFVLARAVSVAAPAGLVIWLLANVQMGGASLLNHCAGFFDPFARLMGLDGYILLAFILGLPANEIVIPILLMSYLSHGSLTELDSLQELHTLLLQRGWTWLTAVCVMLFSLMHWPCGTTLFTIHRETKSVKWTLAAFLIPTACGIIACILVAAIARLLCLV